MPRVRATAASAAASAAHVCAGARALCGARRPPRVSSSSAAREKMNTRRERCVRNRVDTVLLRIIYKTRVVRECVSRDLGRRYYFYELWFRCGSYSLVRGSTSSRQLSRSRDFPSRSLLGRRLAVVPAAEIGNGRHVKARQTETRQRKSAATARLFRPRRRLLALLPLKLLVLLRRFLRVLIPHVIRLIRRRFVLDAGVARSIGTTWRSADPPTAPSPRAPRAPPPRAAAAAAAARTSSRTKTRAREARDSSRAPETTRSESMISMSSQHDDHHLAMRASRSRARIVSTLGAASRRTVVDNVFVDVSMREARFGSDASAKGVPEAIADQARQ